MLLKWVPSVLFLNYLHILRRSYERRKQEECIYQIIIVSNTKQSSYCISGNIEVLHKSVAKVIR